MTMYSTPDQIVPVATAFNAIDLTMTRGCLEAHGVLVAAAPVHTLNNFPHYANATGGYSIFVPASQVHEAQDILSALNWETDWSTQRSQIKRVAVCLIFYLLAGFYAAPPMSGRVLHRQASRVIETGVTRP